jgi:hypothetical protein
VGMFSSDEQPESKPESTAEMLTRRVNEYAGFPVSPMFFVWVLSKSIWAPLKATAQIVDEETLDYLIANPNPQIQPTILFRHRLTGEDLNLSLNELIGKHPRPEIKS